MSFTFNPAYYNTVDQIYHSEWAIGKLARIELLRRLIGRLWPNGHPTRLIHVAGTSGNGSTGRFLEAGLGLVGKAGGYYSPHLFDYRERFSIAGQFAAQDDITAAWENTVKPLCLEMALNNTPYPLSFPEVAILIALVLFEQYQVAWAAIETGLGGRYDQTCALTVAATLLTNVGRDHEHLLGSEHWQRALDKVGICRAGVPFFTSAQNSETLDIVRAVCAQAPTQLYITDDAQVTAFEAQLHAVFADQLPDDSLLNAAHQRRNAALSLAVLRHLFPEIDVHQVIARFANARLPGRFWRVGAGVYADIAHNPEKILALARQIERQFADAGKIFVIGVSGQRLPRALYGPLAKIARAIIITGNFYRGQQAQAVKDELDSLPADIPVLLADDPRQALEMATSMQTATDVVILTGSTYMIEQALNPDPYLRHINLTYGWRNRPPAER